MKLFKIIKDDKVKDNLPIADVVYINKYKRKTQVEKELFEAKKSKMKMKSELLTAKSELEKEEIEAENNALIDKVNNMKMKMTIAKTKQLTDFTDAVNSATKDKIQNYLTTGNKYNTYSLICSIISAMTSCLGVCSSKRFEINIVVICSCIAVLMSSYFCNKKMKSVIPLMTEFYDSKKANCKIDIIMTFAVIFSCMAISIYTNYLFWFDLLNDRFQATFFSIIFDMLSLSFVLSGDSYIGLKFSDKYKEEMQTIDNDILNDIEMTQKKKKVTHKKEKNDVEMTQENDTSDTSKMTYDDFYNIVSKTNINDTLTPDIFNMTSDSDKRKCYRWMAKCELIEKQGKSYVRIIDNQIAM